MNIHIDILLYGLHTCKLKYYVSSGAFCEKTSRYFPVGRSFSKQPNLSLSSTTAPLNIYSQNI